MKMLTKNPVVRPDIRGLEVVALEEGNRREKERGRIFLANTKGPVRQTNHVNREPQNAAIGDLEPSRPGLEIFCRSRKKWCNSWCAE